MRLPELREPIRLFVSFKVPMDRSVSPGYVEHMKQDATRDLALKARQIMRDEYDELFPYVVNFLPWEVTHDRYSFDGYADPFFRYTTYTRIVEVVYGRREMERCPEFCIISRPHKITFWQFLLLPVREQIDYLCYSWQVMRGDACTRL